MKTTTLSAVFLAAGACAMPAVAETRAYSVQNYTDGERIADKAMRMFGKRVVWGAGSVHGPTKGGFDCSGLTLFCVYRGARKIIRTFVHSAVQSNTFAENSPSTNNTTRAAPTAQAQYNSVMGKHLPFDEAEPGDLVFWSKKGNCGHGVVHVGVFHKRGEVVDALLGEKMVETRSIESTDERTMCPSVVRFW
ncbi:hypothetical protein ED733_000338 [Metarhizium rileyi]|uniref:NlpC/P60 domain-containing protein n=1 Tax=Metarhizium rileyi (strain RCEF 4871) TaxID=1649241 RepID=A0A5C6G7D6_METRR|nr:hypothetical protein ED733_000338 [Metarhizium rileyi]